MARALDSLLKLLAPFLPFVTEEVWSWWRSGSIHTSPWPTVAALNSDAGDSDLLSFAGGILSELRRPKTEAKRSLKTRITVAQLELPESDHSRFELVMGDLREAGGVDEFAVAAGGDLRVTATLAPEE